VGSWAIVGAQWPHTSRPAYPRYPLRKPRRGYRNHLAVTGSATQAAAEVIATKTITSATATITAAGDALVESPELPRKGQ